MRETIIHKPWHDQPYVMVDKALITDERLSFKAMGLLVYLIAKPASWRVCLKHLATTHRDGVDAVRSAMDELLACGYARRTLIRNEDGTLAGTETCVSEVPFPPEPEAADAPEDSVTDTGKSVDGSTDIGKSNASKESGSQETKERNPLRKGSPRSVPTEAPIGELADQVLTHLNSLANTSFRSTGFIPARLKDGYTVDECLLVLDWLHEDRRKREPEWVNQYLDHSTPFRAANFDKYLQKARCWKQAGGEDPRKSMAREVAKKVIADIAARGTCSPTHHPEIYYATHRVHN